MALFPIGTVSHTLPKHGLFDRLLGIQSADQKTAASNAKTADYQKKIDALQKQLAATKKSSTTSTKKTTTNKRTYSTGSANSAVDTAPAVAAVEAEPWYYSGDQIAKKFGIVNDYGTILKNLQGATNAKFDEMDSTANRTQDQSLRDMEGQYTQYLNSLRESRANAVSSGITKGTAAAQQLTAMLNGQQGVADTQQQLNDVKTDIGLQRGTALATDQTTANSTANEIGQYLAQIGASYESNDLDRISAQLAAKAQVDAANISAAATKSAAASSASTANAGSDWLLNMLTEANGGDRNKALQIYASYLPYQFGAKNAAVNTGTN